MRVLVCAKRVPMTGGTIVLTDDAQAIETRHLGFTISPHEECGLEEAVRLIEANGWKSVTVVTSSYHVTRAGRLIGQCTTAEVQMVASHPALDVGQWIRRFVIETGGLIDASLRPECANHGA